jgi:chromosome segregation ATPase
MSIRSQVGSAQQKSPVVRHAKASPSNRKCVVVGQKMVKTEETVHSVVDETESVVSTRFSSTSLHEPSMEYEQFGSEQQLEGDFPNPSLSESMRSSGSSFLGSSFGGFDASVADAKLLDELKADIEVTAAQLVKLEVEAENIPVLKKKLEEVEKEKKLTSKELSEKCEIVEMMKQRLSVLHEQNSQLAQLTQKSVDSSETTLRMRNALVASLAQLKKLQGMVDEIPGLKAQISTLKQENLQLKEREQVTLDHFSINIPDGSTPLDYSSLKAENEKLKESRDSLHNEVTQLTKCIEVLSDSLEDTKRRIGNFEKSASNSIPLSNHIKKLEKEKEELYDELIQLKQSKSIYKGVDTLYLENECASLRKLNSHLQRKLDDLTFQYKQQKEKIVMKLFEIEVSNLKSKGFEVEKRLSDVDVNRPSTLKVVAVGDDDKWAALPPQFKAQILKLHQFRLQNEQSHQVTQLILSEKEELEKDLAELNQKLETKSMAKLEGKINGYENKLGIARAKITDLEKRLSFSTQAVGADYSTLVSENFTLKSELSVHASENHAAVVAELQKQLQEEQHLHEVRLQKYKKLKDQNQKLEAKLRESKNRYQGLASELSNSVKLMKKYQIQCVDFERDVEVVSVEKEAFQKEARSLKAELEVIRAEFVQEGSLQPSKVEADSTMLDYQKLLAENSALKERMHMQSMEAETRLQSKNNEFQVVEEKLQVVNRSLAHEQDAIQQANLKIEQLESERAKLEQELSVVKILEQRNKELYNEKAVLSAELEESSCRDCELQSRLGAIEEECLNYQSHLNDSESKLSHVSKEAEDYKSKISELLASVSVKERAIKDLTSDLLQREKELKEEVSFIQMPKMDDPKCAQLLGEIEGYKAMIKSLQRQLDEAETREIEHEILKQKIKLLERSLGDSSHDNKALLKLLHETVQEIPSLSEAEQSLQDKNLQLEEQVSVLSQWNDTQRQEIEQLERTVDDSARAYDLLITEVNRKEDVIEENLQLKRELKEVEIEVNSLRRQVHSDVQEELQVKLEAKTQLLAVFNQHNSKLQQQVCCVHGLSLCIH